MQIRQGLDYGSAKIITLAGVEYFVPVLAVRQNRVCVPLLQSLAPRIGEIIEPGSVMRSHDYDDLLRLIHAALTRAYPDATLDDLLDMEITMDELIQAVNVVMRQTRAFKMADRDAPAGESAGEATASTAPPPASID
jgi:hypothetical protein